MNAASPEILKFADARKEEERWYYAGFCSGAETTADGDSIGAAGGVERIMWGKYGRRLLVPSHM